MRERISEMIEKMPDYRLEPFFDLSEDILCIAGYDGFFKRVNPAFQRLLGYSEEELFRRPINDFVYQEDKDKTASRRQGLVENVPLLNFENRYVKSSGELVWLSWTSIPVNSDKLIYAIAKNVTHNKKMEEERNRQLADFTRINQNLQLLNYSTSHDLRSPVSNLQMVFNLLDMTKIQDKDAQDIIELMKSATADLKQTLNSYIKKLGQGVEAEVVRHKIYIAESVRRVSQSIESLLASSGARIKMDFAAFEEIQFNKHYLDSIFLNLITNSIKYARMGHRPIISIYTTYQYGKKQLVFSDNGQGFDMDQVKDKIFGLHQKFTDRADSQGIGLYLVYNHVTSMGGQVEVFSKPDEGATFTITLKD